MDNVKTRTSAKADRKGLKRRAGDDPFVPYATVDETSVPATSGDHSTPMEIEETGRGATSASSSAVRVPMEVDSTAAKGTSIPLMVQRPSPENSPMISWQQFLCSRMNGRWPRLTSSCKTQINTICHGGDFSLCTSSCAPSMMSLL